MECKKSINISALNLIVFHIKKTCGGKEKENMIHLCFKKPLMTGNRLILLFDTAGYIIASEHRCIVRQHRRHGKPIAALIGNHVNLVYAMPGKN